MKQAYTNIVGVVLETTFFEMRCKEVVNVCNGKALGHISDIVFDAQCGCILGFIVPGGKNYLNFFKNNEELFIPYRNVYKIGADVILVEVNDANVGCFSSTQHTPNQQSVEIMITPDSYTKK